MSTLDDIDLRLGYDPFLATEAILAELAASNEMIEDLAWLPRPRVNLIPDSVNRSRKRRGRPATAKAALLGSREVRWHSFATA